MTSYVLNVFAPEYNTIGLSIFLHGTKHYVLGGPFGPRLPYNLKLVPSYGWYWSDGGAGAYIIGRAAVIRDEEFSAGSGANFTATERTN
jgi:hypothetical protein